MSQLIPLAAGLSFGHNLQLHRLVDPDDFRQAQHGDSLRYAIIQASAAAHSSLILGLFFSKGTVKWTSPTVYPFITHTALSFIGGAGMTISNSTPIISLARIPTHPIESFASLLGNVIGYGLSSKFLPSILASLGRFGKQITPSTVRWYFKASPRPIYLTCALLSGLSVMFIQSYMIPHVATDIYKPHNPKDITKSPIFAGNVFASLTHLFLRDSLTLPMFSHVSAQLFDIIAPYFPSIVPAFSATAPIVNFCLFGFGLAFGSFLSLRFAKTKDKKPSSLSYTLIVEEETNNIEFQKTTVGDATPENLETTQTFEKPPSTNNITPSSSTTECSPSCPFTFPISFISLPKNISSQTIALSFAGGILSGFSNQSVGSFLPGPIGFLDITQMSLATIPTILGTTFGSSAARYFLEENNLFSMPEPQKKRSKLKLL